MLIKQKSIYRQRSWSGLQRWYRDPLGSLYAQAETAILNEILPRLFGYHIVLVGTPSAGHILEESPISHRCRIDAGIAPTGTSVDVLAEPGQLPIAADSVDVVVLPHVLEFVAEPHAVLREVDRILIPEGHLIILGFNPFSIWGFWRWLPGSASKTPWDARLLSVNRLRDWLALLGFDTLNVRYCFYRPPLKRLRLLDKLDFLERMGAKWWPFGGGGYVVLAKKRVSTLTPVKRRRRVRQRILTEGVANPSMRKFHRDRSR